MKRYGLIVLSTAVLFSLCSCGHYVKSYAKPDIHLEVKSLGIMPFSSNIPEVGKVVSDTIGAGFLASGFKVVDRTHIGRILQEEDVSYLRLIPPITSRSVTWLRSIFSWLEMLPSRVLQCGW